MPQSTNERTFNITSPSNHFRIADLRDVLIQEKQDTSQLHSANHFEIVYLRYGTGKLSVNLQQYQLDTAHIYLISPGQLRTFFIEEDASVFYISISSDFFMLTDNLLLCTSTLQQYRGLGNALVMSLDQNSSNAIDEMIDRMKKELSTPHALQLEILQALFKTFLLYISKGNAAAMNTGAKSNDERIVKKFMQLVNMHFVEKKMVADYASELCVTRSYLNKLVKKVSGFTASQIIQQRVIQEAKKQAMGSDSSLKQIAYSLGFDDSAHFSKFFKSVCGINFTNYKKQLFTLQ